VLFYKLDLLTNATVVDDAIRFVAKDTIKSACGKGDEEESNEPDYDEDKDQLEEEQEVETGKIAATTLTTNQVF
jgi:hypothetical protein